MFTSRHKGAFDTL